MIKPSFLKIILYLFVKYLVFFTVLAFLDNRYKNIVINNSKYADDIVINSIYYIVEVLFAVLLYIVIFFLPLYLLLKIKNILFLLLAFLLLIIIEYFVYEATSSYIHMDIDGIINEIISFIFFFVFFGKFIVLLAKGEINNEK